MYHIGSNAEHREVVYSIKKLINLMTNLYETDINLWYEKTAKALRNKNLEEIDWNNLAEEIEDMGRSEKRALDSYIQRLIEHLMKLHLWAEEIDRCEKGWKAEIKNFRNQAKRIIRKNPSLKNYAIQEYAENFKLAKDRMNGYFEVPDNFAISISKALDDKNFN